MDKETTQMIRENYKVSHPADSNENFVIKIQILFNINKLSDYILIPPNLAVTIFQHCLITFLPITLPT